MLHRLHEAHPGQFAMKILATQYIWWPEIYREIQVHGEKCIECVKAGEKLKPLLNHIKLGKIPNSRGTKLRNGIEFCRSATFNMGNKKIHIGMR